VAALEANKPAHEFMRALMIEERCKVSTVNFFMNQDNLIKKLKHPLVVICSDGAALATNGKLGEGVPHPRSYGTFPRVLGTFVREEHVLSLESAIQKMTSTTAQHFGLTGRGELREGFKADIVVFNPDTVADRATYAEPAQYPDGIPYVLVNGRLVISESEHTGVLAGQMLRRS
jgi:N-acyl-D-amino-acid deacylase